MYYRRLFFLYVCTIDIKKNLIFLIFCINTYVTNFISIFIQFLIIKTVDIKKNLLKFFVEVLGYLLINYKVLILNFFFSILVKLGNFVLYLIYELKLFLKSIRILFITDILYLSCLKKKK